MKIIPLHTTNTSIVYKNSLCSMATVLVLVIIALSVLLPVLLVSLLSPYSGISESKILYEQPRLNFRFEYIFVAHLQTSDGQQQEPPTQNKNILACSSFTNFNVRLAPFTQQCESSKFWLEDLDHDTNTDRAHFQLQLDSLPTSTRLKSFELILFFDAHLKHKCDLSPPAVLLHHHILPSNEPIRSGRVALSAELQLKQYAEFSCPFPGRSIQTHFRQVQLDTNNNYTDITQYQMESILAQIKANPAYFQLDMQHIFYNHQSSYANSGLSIGLELDVLQVPARYHLSIWERLGQFWLYFASFFGISFYIMNRLKDVLFGRHIIRSYEVIPWKKLY